MISESLSFLLSGMKFWKDRKKDAVEERRLRDSAIGSVMEAALQTKAYQYNLQQGAKPDRAKEEKLSTLWREAGYGISQYDHQLFESGRLKALGWADPREWRRAESREWAIDLDKIVEQCDWLKRNC